MKKIVAIFTTTRAEYGAFKPLLDAISTSSTVSYLLFVGGAHLSDDCGRTLSEIEAQGYPIAGFFDYLNGDNSPFGLSCAMGRASLQLAELFNKFSFDFVCLAGDRYELLPIAQTAILFRRPILHLYGGEITEGVIDEQVRHMITKSAHIHFTSCALHTKNVIAMGEESWRVFTTGELVVDVMARIEKLEKDTLFADFELDPEREVALLSYHPVADNELISSAQQMSNIFEALKDNDIQLIVTAPNVEVGSEEILSVIQSYVKENKNYRYCKSLGALRYYSFLTCSSFVIGNSSSGILEAPFYKVPSVNVGSRQQGRIRHASVIDVDNTISSIRSGIARVNDAEFRSSITKMYYQLGEGNAAQKMVNIIDGIVIDGKLLNKRLVFDQ